MVWSVLFSYSSCDIQDYPIFVISERVWFSEELWCQEKEDEGGWNASTLSYCICHVESGKNVPRQIFVSYQFIWFFLIFFMSLVSFYTSWKYGGTSGFLVFSGGIGKCQWHSAVKSLSGHYFQSILAKCSVSTPFEKVRKLKVFWRFQEV